MNAVAKVEGSMYDCCLEFDWLLVLCHALSRQLAELVARTGIVGGAWELHRIPLVRIEFN